MDGDGPTKLQRDLCSGRLGHPLVSFTHLDSPFFPSDDLFNAIRELDDRPMLIIGGKSHHLSKKKARKRDRERSPEKD